MLLLAAEEAHHQSSAVLFKTERLLAKPPATNCFFRLFLLQDVRGNHLLYAWHPACLSAIQPHCLRQASSSTAPVLGPQLGPVKGRFRIGCDWRWLSCMQRTCNGSEQAVSTKDALQGSVSPTFHPKISRLVWLIVHYVTICKKRRARVVVLSWRGGAGVAEGCAGN